MAPLAAKSKDMKVTWADTFRDGGSYEVEFQDSDGGKLVIFLQVRWNLETQSFDGYGELYDRSQYGFDGSEQPIMKGGKREKEIVDFLEKWVNDNVSADIRDRIAKGDWKNVQNEILLPVRLTCDIPVRRP